MQISFATPTTLESTEHVVIAEELGYERAWFYDTPQQSPDVWMMLALAAQATERIGLGPGVLVPTLRHPMVNAAATAALEALAPGRVAVAFGTGFSGRRAMGVRSPIKWSYMADYIRAYKGLLHGDTIEWEGAHMRMLHPTDSTAPLPVNVPVMIAALGPKGYAVAKELGDGVFTAGPVPPEFAKEFPWVPHLCYGTTLDDGEDPTSERIRLAAGPAVMNVYHVTYEGYTSFPVTDLPGGAEWLAVVEQTVESERHLAVHHQHLVGLNAADDAAWENGASNMVEALSFSGTARQLRDKVAALAEGGATEVVFQPSGPDVRRELEAFMAAVGSADFDGPAVGSGAGQTQTQAWTGGSPRA
jgi:5,10-methylenetetrahydromethanopterin reductase